MPSRHRIASFWIISLGLLLLYGWTLTESADVTLRVDQGHCTAELYGRTSTINCSGLVGGSLARFSESSGQAAPSLNRGPLDLLVPPAEWISLELSDSDGRALPTSTRLPSTFEAQGRLRRPDSPGGIALLRPDEDSGWIFILDGTSRRGEWREWSDGEPAAPLQGVPFDKPLLTQTQSLLRRLLNGWQGAVLLLAFGLVLSRLFAIKVTTRITLPPPVIPPAWIIAALSLFVFAVALHLSADVLERIPHVQDALTYLFQARTLAGGELTAPAPPLADTMETRHFAQEFLLVRDGRWFGKYPPGYPALLAVGVAAGAHWLVNPLLAALTVPLLYALTKSLYPAATRHPLPPAHYPLTTVHWSLLLLVTSPFFLIMSGSLMAHAAELFWTTLFMLAWVKALGGGRQRWAAVAGVAIGALFLTRQFTALTIALSFGLGWLLVAFWQRRSGPSANDQSQTAQSPHLLRSPAPLLLLTATPFLLALFAYQAAVTGDPLTDPRLLYWPYDRVGFGPGIGEAENIFTFAETDVGPAIQWVNDPAQPPRGHTPSRGLYNLGRNYEELERHLFGWPALFTLSFVWLAFLLRRPVAADWLLLLIILAVGGGYVAFWAAGIAYGPRYFYAALPALVILTARGITALGTAAGRQFTAILLIALIGYNLFTLPGRIEAYRDYNFVSAGPRAAVEAAVNTPALVFITADATDWWEYGAFFSGNTPWLDGDIIYARDLGAAENERLRAEFPGRAAYLWRDGRLSPIAP
jgi:hypothetical protein